MAMTPGLSPNIRVSAPPEPGNDNAPDVEVFADDETPVGDGDVPTLDDKGNILRIDHADGSVTVSLDGRPIGTTDKSKDKGWFSNLAENLSDEDLGFISGELLRGIDADIQSRSDWIESRAQGIRLLGLTIEVPNMQQSNDAAPVEGMSKVRHPLLLEAVLRYQANVRSELLPVDGPVKIREDSNNGSAELDDLANALEKDMNHYLTTTATEYYPDTDRMFFMQGFGGVGFKKVYNCPLRNRPVSESVDADDLIVNNMVTDLANAKRITHRIMMKPSTVKRMQIVGAYIDVDLPDPQEKKVDAVDEQKAEQQGVSTTINHAIDRDREIYECYCELNIPGYEHKIRGKETGLQLPYIVTIDRSSQKVLSIVRNYNKGDGLPVARKRFVKFTFVPGLGFYDIGLLHILGNTTNAVTAAWRELLDAGMFASFPGFLYSDAGARQNTNVFRVPPGGGAKVNTGGMPIGDSVMPLPYKDPSPALMSLVENISEYGQRVGGTAEMAVGEGRQDAPVGTTLAVIEQAIKVLSSVHKRMHAAQAEEFQLLVECFRENPKAFWQNNRKPAYPWDEQVFREALKNYYLTPQADPNTSSSTHRLMKATALVQLASAQPQIYNMQAVNKQALRTIGFSNVDEFLLPPNASPTPDVLEKSAKISLESRKVAVLENESKAKIQKMGADTQEGAAKLQIEQAKVHQGGLGGAQQDPEKTRIEGLAAQADLIDAHAHLAQIREKANSSIIESRNRENERQSRDQLAEMDLHRDKVNNAVELALETMRMQSKREEIAQRNEEAKTDLEIANKNIEAAKYKDKGKYKPAKKTSKKKDD